MIECKNLSKRFGTQVIFNDASFNLPNQGLVSIVSPSGGGKSTLLHLLSMLDDDYEGRILIDGNDYSKIEDKEQYRFNHFGFVFQNYSLFNLLSVKDNIALNSVDDNKTNSKVKKVLALVGLKIDINKNVNLLSGGEKQRVAIARALFNDPDILFCDEPTGALDKTNKENIMQLLKDVSKEKLVVLVSHEMNLVESYSDFILRIDNNKVVGEVSNDNEKRIRKVNKDNKLDVSYMFHYCKTNLLQKKYRSMIAVTSIAIGLVCIGISIVLTSIIGSSILSNLMSLMDEEALVMQQTSTNESNEIYAATKDTVTDIKNDYSRYVKDSGIFYFSNFENQFINENYASMDSGEYEVSFSELSIRSINEYRLIDEYDRYYPELIDEYLERDEIILCLRQQDIKRINRSLYLSDDSVQRLEEYLRDNTLSLIFHFKNDSWSYQDELYFHISHFTVGKELAIIHSDRDFNEYVFENLMRFKASDDLVSLNILPWTFKKVNYLRVNQNYIDDFLRKIMVDKKYKEYSFDMINESNSISFRSGDSLKKRVYVSRHTQKMIPLADVLDIQEKESFNDYILSVPNSYIVLPSLMIDGFSRATFVSAKEDEIITINDLYSFSEVNINQYPAYQNSFSMAYGGLGDITSNSNLKYRVLKEGMKIIGRKPNNYNEIVISSTLARILFPNYKDLDVINKNVFFSTIANSTYNGAFYTNQFVDTSLKIVGIVDDDICALYHDSFWSILFFAQKLNYELSSLKIDAVRYNLDKNYTQEQIDVLNLKYNKVQFSNPSLNISKSIDEVVNYFNLALIAFALIAIVSSILMTILVIYLFIVENKREIGLLKALGINKQSIRLLFMFLTGLIALVSFIYSMLILLINELLICYMLDGGFALFSISSLFKAGGLMLLVISLISLIIGYFSSFQALKYDPIKVLKEE